MKARTFGLLALLALGACQSADDRASTPATADIDRLEALLAKQPCVGDLNSWERNYRFSRTSGTFFPYSLTPDHDVVELHLRKVGTVSINAARNITAPHPDGDWPDSRPIKFIDGRFTLSNGALSLKGCPR